MPSKQTYGLLTLLSCAVLLCLAPDALAQLGRRLYSVSPDLSVRRIDPLDGGTLSSRRITLEQPADLSVRGFAVHPVTGEMYVNMRPGGFRALCRLDPQDGFCEYIGALPSRMEGLAFGGDGTLYGVTNWNDGEQEKLYVIDPTDASATFLMDVTSNPGEDYGTLAFSHSDGRLYRATGHQLEYGRFFEAIDPSTQQITSLPLSGAVYDSATALAHSCGVSLYLTDESRGFHVILQTGLVGALGALDHHSGGMALVDSTLYSISSWEGFLNTIDLNDGTTLSSVPLTLLMPPLVGEPRGLAAHPTTGELFLPLRLDDGDRILGKLDPVTAEVELIGPLGDSFSGLAFDGGGVLYGVTGDGADVPETLYTIDTNDASTTLFLALGNGDDGEAIAYNPLDGKLYHLSGRTGVVFESIDLGTKQVTNIPLTGPTLSASRSLCHAGGLAFLASDGEDLFNILHTGLTGLIGPMDHTSKGMVLTGGGKLYSIDGDAYLRALDPGTGVTLSTTAMTVPISDITDVTGVAAANDEVGSLFVLATTGDVSGSRLGLLDPATGSVRLLGETGDDFAGLVVDGAGTLFGVTADTATIPESLFTLDPSDGAATLVQNLGNGGAGETIAFSAWDGLLYHASGAGVPNSEEILESIDPGTFQISPVTLTGADYDQALGMTWWVGETLLIADQSQDLYSVASDGRVWLRGPMDHATSGLAFVTARDDIHSISAYSDHLFTLDPIGFRVARKVKLEVPGVAIDGANGLARDPTTGDLYAILQPDGYVPRVLAQIDETGGGTLLGSTGDFFASLACDDAGVLYGVTGDGAATPETLYFLSKTTGAPTLLFALGNGTGGEAITFRSPDQLLYHASGKSDSLVFETVDPGSMAITPIVLSGDVPYGTTALGATPEGDLLYLDRDDLYLVTPSGESRYVARLPQDMKGITARPGAYLEPYGTACPGANGFAPELLGFGEPRPGETITLTVRDAYGGAASLLLIGLGEGTLPVTAGCSLQIGPVLPSPSLAFTMPGSGPGTGEVDIVVTLPPDPITTSLRIQVLTDDPGGAFDFSSTNPLRFLVAP